MCVNMYIVQLPFSDTCEKLDINFYSEMSTI